MCFVSTYKYIINTLNIKIIYYILYNYYTRYKNESWLVLELIAIKYI